MRTGTTMAMPARMTLPESMNTPVAVGGKMRSRHAAFIRLTPMTMNRGPITTGVAR